MTQVRFIQYLYSIGIIDYAFLKKHKQNPYQIITNIIKEISMLSYQLTKDMIERIFIIWSNKNNIIRQNNLIQLLLPQFQSSEQKETVKQQNTKKKNYQKSDDKNQSSKKKIVENINNKYRKQNINLQTAKNCSNIEEISYLQKIRNMLKTQTISPNQAKNMIRSIKDHKQIRECTFKPKINKNIIRSSSSKECNLENTKNQSFIQNYCQIKQLTDQIKQKPFLQNSFSSKQIQELTLNENKNDNIIKQSKKVNYDKQKDYNFFVKIEDYQKRKKERLQKITNDSIIKLNQKKITQ